MNIARYALTRPQLYLKQYESRPILCTYWQSQGLFATRRIWKPGVPCFKLVMTRSFISRGRLLFSYQYLSFMCPNSQLNTRPDTSQIPPSYYEAKASSFRVSGPTRQRPSLRATFFWHRGHREQKCLARICDLVTAPNYIPESAIHIVNDCAATLSVSQFSSLLQSPNIRGHTAMYWAIVNDRREVLSAVKGFISTPSTACSDDLRLACMSISDHALFIELGLEQAIGRTCTADTYLTEY